METGIRRENRQGVRRYDCSCFYPAGISGLSFPSEGITGKLNKGILYGKITFVTDDGGKEEFYVEEQTRINGVNYILVSDSKDDEANAYILKDISTTPTQRQSMLW